MKKTFTLGGKEVTLATVSVNIAESVGLGKGQLTVQEFNKKLVVASLIAGGDLEATIESIGEHAFFATAEDPLDAYIKAAFEVNGISTAGEKQPAGPATSDSTSIGSTAA
jgi:hypothetical protein